MALDVYHRKRDFSITPEPKGRVHKAKPAGLSFVIQKHRASHLHYDFRLELDGVLLSWAVPKGPSLDPADKRLAMQTEDHPIEYGEFEGVIPAKQYGGGTVMLWDRGTWTPEGDPREGYRKGKLKFQLDGEKLQGMWTLVRAWARKGQDPGRENRSWFLIKIDDDHARRGDAARIVEEMPRSVASGRDLDEIAADPDRVWHSNKSVQENMKSGAVKRARRASVQVKNVAGARKAALPAMIEPQLATLAKVPPEGDQWLHEIKYDGYRMVCRITAGEARMISRNGHDWTARFGPIPAALLRLPVKEAWLDGEVVAMQSDGKTSFQALQNALGAGDTRDLVLWVFDVMYVDGQDLTNVPLGERKTLLEGLLKGAPATIRYSAHFEGNGEAVHAQACRLGLEGIVSKRRDAPYSSRRGKDWLKIKCAQRQEMVIGGYTDPSGSRSGFGALLLGVHDGDGALRYCGKVGTGFNEALLKTLAPRLAKLEQKSPPFTNPPRGYEAKGAHWVRPDLVAEIAFTEWTRDGTVRHPSFQGLREDKDPADVVLERPVGDVETGTSDGRSSRRSKVAPSPGATAASPTPVAATKPTRDSRKSPTAAKTGRAKAIPSTKPSASATSARSTKSATRQRPSKSTGQDDGEVAGIPISNPEKLLYPEAGYSKLDLARYYAAVSDWMVPHLRGRPLTLVRCPNGWKRCFYQKHAKDGASEVIEQVEIRESTGVGTYMIANTASAVVALLQLGVLELHPWGSTRGRLDRPDRLIFDFDPDEGLEWQRLVDAVHALKTLLDQLGLEAFLKTTGGKGLHVVVPVRPEHDWEVARGFTKAVADLLVRASPDRFTSQLAKARRGGKIFIDYLRNSEGATAVAPYSLRAKADAPVSLPIGWHDLAEDQRFARWNAGNVPEMLQRRPDPWADFADAAKQRLTGRTLAAVGLR